MSSANLDLVRSIYAAWEHGDYTSVDWAQPEIEFVRAGGPGPWTGVADMAEGWREFLSAWEEFRPAAEGYRELDDSVCSCSTPSAGAAKQADWRSGRRARRERACFTSVAAR
jgi:ketosteroid isomerase-like protein